MSITVNFFGMLAEATEKTSIELTDVVDTDTLIKILNKDFSKLSACKYAIAINKQLVSGNIKLSSGDEIALLPPFSGG